jgi:hypothetical protein
VNDAARRGVPGNPPSQQTLRAVPSFFPRKGTVHVVTRARTRPRLPPRDDLIQYSRKCREPHHPAKLQSKPIKFEPNLSYVLPERKALADLEFKNRDVCRGPYPIRLELHKLNVSKALNKRSKCRRHLIPMFSVRKSMMLCPARIPV